MNNISSDNNNNNAWTGVKCNGHLHVGISINGKHYQRVGTEISLFNYRLTQLFAKIFGLSEKININGKIFYVEKKSFRKHLASLKIKSEEIEKVISDIKTSGYKEYLNTRDLSTLPITGESLGACLSKAKRDKYSLKAFEAVINRNEEKAMEYVRKGADLDRLHYVIIPNPQYNCKKQESYFCNYTLLAAAKEKGFDRLVSLIKSNHIQDDEKDRKRTYYQYVEHNDRGRKYLKVTELYSETLQMLEDKLHSENKVTAPNLMDLPTFEKDSYPQDSQNVYSELGQIYTAKDPILEPYQRKYVDLGDSIGADIIQKLSNRDAIP